MIGSLPGTWNYITETENDEYYHNNCIVAYGEKNTEMETVPTAVSGMACEFSAGGIS